MSPTAVVERRSLDVSRVLSAVALSLIWPAALAATPPVDLQQCKAIADRERRLDCFDRLAAEPTTTGDGVPASAPVLAIEGPSASEGTASRSGATTRFNLAERWELGAVDKRGVFLFRPHRYNYVLVANYATAPNSAPYEAAGRLEPGATLAHTEVAFQLGFKMKLVENALRQPLDLWFGYTQNSFWQAYNHAASSPFRETDYQPELMAVVPVDLSPGGLRLRFVNVGIVHQSNGQVSSLSRSWNRAYAQLGAEIGDVALLARVWTRVGGIDDNPDIYRYMGHGDLVAGYRWRGHEFAGLLRRNVASDKGAVQASWAFPVIQNLKGYVQVFSGYGASLIDYNSYQHTYGLGFLVDF